jgi:hypothetical protein
MRPVTVARTWDGPRRAGAQRGAVGDAGTRVRHPSHTAALAEAADIPTHRYLTDRETRP